jgi:hypothetical protein
MTNDESNNQRMTKSERPINLRRADVLSSFVIKISFVIPSWVIRHFPFPTYNPSHPRSPLPPPAAP